MPLCSWRVVSRNSFERARVFQNFVVGVGLCGKPVVWSDGNLIRGLCEVICEERTMVVNTAAQFAADVVPFIR